jgi:hypothetical protein
MSHARPWLSSPPAIIGIVLFALAFAACETDKERIDAQNAAARTAEAAATTPAADDIDDEPTSVANDEPRDVSVFDLRVGDCLTEDAILVGESDALGEATQTEVIDCASLDAYARVSKLHLLDDGDETEYPGDDAMIAVAEAQCATPGQPYTYYTPTQSSWVLGDRAITCIETTVFAYRIGSCVAGNDEGYRVLPCDVESHRVFGDVVRIIDVTADYGPAATLPEDAVWDEIFDVECSADADYFLYPTEDTWAEGDRLLICVQTR